jgi:CheY-like chemotaxis protein
VLLAEDDGKLRTLIGNTLRTAGYTVLEGSNGEEALDIARTVPIDLLLTDVVMAGASGARLAEVLRPLRPEMGVLFMSGYAEDTIVRAGVLTPDVAYLQKPFTTTALARKVREVLEAWSARPQESRRAVS